MFLINISANVSFLKIPNYTLLKSKHTLNQVITNCFEKCEYCSVLCKQAERCVLGFNRSPLTRVVHSLEDTWVLRQGVKRVLFLIIAYNNVNTAQRAVTQQKIQFNLLS